MKLLDKLEDRYGGFLTAVLVALVLLVLFGLWVFAVAWLIWPVVAPLVIFGYMAWSVRND